MMALKMLYRGPSSRLENLIEKIQATKEITSNGKFKETEKIKLRVKKLAKIIKLKLL